MDNKLNVGVIFGGKSSEYEVSLKSASSVLKNIDNDKYSIYMIGITKNGDMYYYNGDIDSIEQNKWLDGNICPCVFSQATSDQGFILLKNPIEKIKLDCVFPVLHGKNGEDGTIQGLFTMAGIPFVGCSVLASSCCMDKAVTHALLKDAGIKQANWLTFLKTDYYKNKQSHLESIAETLKFPCFVKPANAGSSVGITKAFDLESLEQGMDIAFNEDRKVIVEEGIVGIELECAVLGNDEPIASCLGEIVPIKEFYDYNAKYIDGTTKTYAPARISNDISDRIREVAIKAYKILGCEGLTRVDFFLKEDNTIILNEPNTIPGFTSISMYPQLFIKSGISYKELITRLIELAIERNEAL